MRRASWPGWARAARSQNPGFVDLVARRRFHTAIYPASHNDILISALDATGGSASRWSAASRSATRRPPSTRNCVINRDAAGAADVMRRHIDTSGKAGAGERDVPVEIGGCRFTPGAHVVSDEDGVVALPS
ncbi:hypothetical protein AB0F81_03685 [Actinoplanes sp. NPDC024001]|uniref:RraA family protein n=1 Tax=Actinoplanes sp. NPDC024001 TaxID=3154598 RepID=UPI00340C8AB6